MGYTSTHKIKVDKALYRMMSRMQKAPYRAGLPDRIPGDFRIWHMEKNRGKLSQRRGYDDSEKMFWSAGFEKS